MIICVFTGPNHCVGFLIFKKFQKSMKYKIWEWPSHPLTQIPIPWWLNTPDHLPLTSWLPSPRMLIPHGAVSCFLLEPELPVRLPNLPLTGCAASGKFLNLSVAQVHPSQNGVVWYLCHSIIVCLNGFMCENRMVCTSWQCRSEVMISAGSLCFCFWFFISLQVFFNFFLTSSVISDQLVV